MQEQWAPVVFLAHSLVPSIHNYNILIITSVPGTDNPNVEVCFSNTKTVHVTRQVTPDPQVSILSKHSAVQQFHPLWKLRLLPLSTCILSSLKSTLIMTASHGDILVQGSLTAQKEHARFYRSTAWWSYRATLLVLQPLQMLHICPLLSMPDNGRTLNMWSCPSSSFGIVFVGFQEH